MLNWAPHHRYAKLIMPATGGPTLPQFKSCNCKDLSLQSRLLRVISLSLKIRLRHLFLSLNNICHCKNGGRQFVATKLLCGRSKLLPVFTAKAITLQLEKLILRFAATKVLQLQVRKCGRIRYWLMWSTWCTCWAATTGTSDLKKEEERIYAHCCSVF